MTKITMAAFFMGSALFATAALADGMSNTGMAPTNTMAPASNAMSPASGGMMAHHTPKPKKHTAPAAGGMMAPANTMAPGNGMAPSNTMGGSH